MGSLAAGDTIAAISTAPGRGGIGVIRLSGPAAPRIAERICDEFPVPRRAMLCNFREPATAEVLDAGLVLYFPAPASLTGEDVVELQAHGSPVVLDLLLRACCRAGARIARPGEFSERAFLNDKLDLVQAEAVADLIDSATESAARGAARSLRGDFSRTVEALAERTASLRVYLEAAIDFPEEEVDFVKEGDVANRLQQLLDDLESIFAIARQGSILRDGMKLVIAGKPNTGKSTLLNALSGQDAAIVTPVEGTTRDVLREHIHIDGMPLHIVDTAGLRDSTDLVEREGIRRARREMETADRILLTIDASDPETRPAAADSTLPRPHERLPESVPVTVVYNKCDLAGLEPEHRKVGDGDLLILSARTGAGLQLLREHLKQTAGYRGDAGRPFLARRRHLDALERARHFLLEGMRQLGQRGAGELLAEDLRQCHRCLGEITGAMSSDELLGEIFSSFCIGK